MSTSNETPARGWVVVLTAFLLLAYLTIRGAALWARWNAPDPSERDRATVDFVRDYQARQQATSGYENARIAVELDAPRRALAAFLGHIRAGRTNTAYGLTTAAFQERCDADGFAVLLQEWPVLTQLELERTGGTVNLHRKGTSSVCRFEYPSRGLVIELREVTDGWRVESIDRLQQNRR